MSYKNGEFRRGKIKLLVSSSSIRQFCFVRHHIFILFFDINFSEYINSLQFVSVREDPDLYPISLNCVTGAKGLKKKPNGKFEAK